MQEKLEFSKIPRFKSCLCCDLKSGNIFICRLEFLLTILGIVFVSFGGVGFFYAAINDVRFSDNEDGFIRTIFYEFNVISYGLFSVTLLTLMAVFSYYFLDGVKMNEPRNLLPYTFKNVFFGIILTAYGLCFLSPLFFLGVYFILLATFNYSLFDAISLENEEKLLKSLTSQQRTQNGKITPAIEISSNDQE
ncbi:unnamed protein product [Chironomus riparius]|uniref:Uncharacterized protein n=1 Tax=Chironomus riparius TaxID=315576 RepID=A0A9N9S891_9DIPT|nr:unnamed protein product [Chironomus riparius]